MKWSHVKTIDTSKVAFENVVTNIVRIQNSAFKTEMQ